jgi:murein DD-endopeptidase MepM/ murein hydrolase activator NlpD
MTAAAATIGRGRSIGRKAHLDLGTTPPLSGRPEGLPFDRRTISLRWLFATALSGIGGLALIGSALFASLDSRSFVALAPERAAPVRAIATVDGVPLRADRLITAPDIAAARQSFRAPTPIRVGDREVIRQKPYVRLATTLALTTGNFATDVPRFDTQRLFASGPIAADRSPEPPPAPEREGEVSVQRRPLADEVGRPLAPFVLTEQQIETQVEEARRLALLALRSPTLGLAPQQMLARAMPVPDPMQQTDVAVDRGFSNIQVTVVPENVTAVAKIQTSTTGSAATTEERLVVMRRGESFEQALVRSGVGLAQARSALAAVAVRLKDGTVREGQRVKLLVAVPGAGRAEAVLLRAIVLEDDRPVAIAALNDRNQYVSVAPPVQEGAPLQQAAMVEEDEEQDDGRGVRLYESIYETAARYEIPRPIVEQLVRVFFFDTDLQRRVSGGDSLEVFYAEDEESAGRHELLYAALSVAGTTKRYFRYASAPDAPADFFDETGRSNRRFLLRKPISDGIFRSGFGSRYHPILRYSRMHTGVDWANKIGTPIIAAGDGTVIKAEWDSGYGRRIEIQHAYNFVTTYSHLSAFGRGIAEGAKVRQGQVIGYLGNSGLSTGPHLHYEVLVNDSFVDPMTIRIPQGRELDSRQIAEFKAEKNRIEELMKKAPSDSRLSERVVR